MKGYFRKVIIGVNAASGSIAEQNTLPRRKNSEEMAKWLDTPEGLRVRVESFCVPIKMRLRCSSDMPDYEGSFPYYVVDKNGSYFLYEFYYDEHTGKYGHTQKAVYTLPATTKQLSTLIKKYLKIPTVGRRHLTQDEIADILTDYLVVEHTLKTPR